MAGRSTQRRQRLPAMAVAAAAAAVAAVAALGSSSAFAAIRSASTGVPAAGQPQGFNQGAMPKEATIYRSIETKRKRALPNELLPDYYGKHPCPPKEEILSMDIPGGVQRRTVREQRLRKLLSRGERPEPEEFDKIIQVFAQRARQELRWLAVQRREFIRRAKRWASEMLLQEMEPSSMSVRLILQGCASVGDIAGAEYWFGWMEGTGREVGRLEYNAVITALGQEGRPQKAREWMARMEEAGLQPDAKSYAGLVEAYEKVGNRRAMLETLMELKQAESEGKLGEPVEETDAALPYYAMARSYMKVADAPRAMSILKMLQAKGVPLSSEAHRIRLESHLRVPAGPRRSLPEIEKALVDLVNSRTQGAPLYNSKLAAMARGAIGVAQYHKMLGALGATEAELVPKLPEPKESERFRKASIQAALKSKAKSGQALLTVRNDDEAYLRSRKKARKPAQIGQVAGGYRVPGKAGLPEWMTLQKPEKFGG